MPDDASWLWGILSDGVRPDLQMSVAAWAEAHRILPEHTPEPGPWSNARTPYLVQIMEALSPLSPIERVVFMKGAQIGATSAGDNWVGAAIAHSPGVMLMGLPSYEDVRKAVTTRIDPLIDSTPALRRLVAKARGRRGANSQTKKTYPGGVLLFTSATSPKGLRSTSVRFLYLDEVDGFPGDAGGEGDPIYLAEQRTVAFRGRRKIYLVSTPLIQGLSRIEKAYAASDQRVYEVPCRACGVLSRIMWRDIVWPSGKPHLAEWQCPACSRTHPENLKEKLLADGAWRATAQSADGKTAGFHLSALYSPFESWGDIAILHRQAGGDPKLLQAWTNTRLGEPFEDRSGELIDAADVQQKAEAWERTHLPAGVVVLVASVDVQDDRLELCIWGYGTGEETWLIDYQVIPGSPALADPWRQIDAIIQQRWPHPRLIPDMPISACCVDTGGHHSRMAYNFVRDKAERRVWAIKGHYLPGKPIWPNKPTYKNKGRIPLYMLGTDAAKETIYSRLKIDSPGPGFIHLPSDLPASFYKGLVSERCVTRFVKGRAQRVWLLPSGRRNEPLDLAVYGLAGLYGLIAMGLDLDKEAAALALHPLRNAAPAAPVPAPKKSRVIARFEV